MRIAQVAPLMERVPPRLYGGTERIVSYLTEALVDQGHAVTLFASGDSRTAASLVACSGEALRLDPAVIDIVPHMALMLERVRQRADEFDVLHFHIDCVQMPLLRELGSRAVTTLHGRLDLPDLQPFYREFSDVPLVSISMAQRAPMPPVNWIATVYHGLPDPGPPGAGDGGYLAFLGRISPEKRPDRAIEIARRSGMPLVMAAKVDKVDKDYFETVVEPLLDGDRIRFIGEVDEDQRLDFLGRARALLFPIDWPEPFGLVMIEAMSQGTPTIAFRKGSVPEVIDDGVSGFIVDDVDGAVDAVGRLPGMDRAAVRRRFDQRFTAARMAGDYLDIYGRLRLGQVSPRRVA
ncbi:glycosyltransferase family 4 protein [Rhodocista pekingensis]|uniref:Glycosyltransferase family 4 protein n=1 Tax=Rhodocista pekingensis TaxID=201185 RepID=A0ABW2KX70_9PROT